MVNQQYNWVSCVSEWNGPARPAAASPCAAVGRARPRGRRRGAMLADRELWQQPRAFEAERAYNAYNLCNQPYNEYECTRCLCLCSGMRLFDSGP